MKEVKRARPEENDEKDEGGEDEQAAELAAPLTSENCGLDRAGQVENV